MNGLGQVVGAHVGISLGHLQRRVPQDFLQVIDVST